MNKTTTSTKTAAKTKKTKTQEIPASIAPATDPQTDFSGKVSEDVTHPWGRFKSFVETIEPSPLEDLAIKYFGPTEEPGELEERELVVLVVEHLEHELQREGLGAQIMQGVPHFYTGSHWSEIPENELPLLLGRFAERMGIKPSLARSHGFRNNLRKQFCSRLRSEPVAESTETILTNHINGTLEIQDGQVSLRDFRRDDLLIYQLPFKYDPGATCPLFQQYLDRVLPDKQTHDVLAEFFGWPFLPGLKLEKMLLLHGGGHNGKSVMFDVINALYGNENISNLSLKSLGKMENRFRLGNSLLNFSTEITAECDSDVFKKLVSCEPIEARRLYHDTFEMRHYARLAFSTNIMPASLDQTDGFYRRFLIIPFEQRITEEEKDVDLARKIIGHELPGVFNWVLDGMRRLNHNRKFSPCAVSDAALAVYRTESDSVALFLEESRLKPSPDGRISKDQLFRDYREFCKSGGLRAVSKVQFGRQLKNRHHIQDSHTGSQRVWLLTRTGA